MHLFLINKNMKANLIVIGTLLGLTSALRLSHHHHHENNQADKDLKFDPHELTDGVMPPGESDVVKTKEMDNVKSKLSAKELVAQENKHL